MYGARYAEATYPAGDQTAFALTVEGQGQSTDVAVQGATGKVTVLGRR